MGANKVIVDGEAIIDLTGDTATPETVAEGVTFHTADGEQAVGTMKGGAANVVQEMGDSTTAVMSQKTVTDLIVSLEERIQALEAQLYVPISITSFYTTPSYFEMGLTLSSLSIGWKTSKTPTKLSLTKYEPYLAENKTSTEELSPNETVKKLTGISAEYGNNITLTLKATDEKGFETSKTISPAFYNGVYYGVSAEPAAYDSAFVLGLTKELRGSKKPSINVNAGEGEYIYYCLPARMGECSFTVGGFTGGFELVDTIEFKNAYFYTESYYIYKSDSANLGETSVTII